MKQLLFWQPVDTGFATKDVKIFSKDSNPVPFVTRQWKWSLSLRRSDKLPLDTIPMVETLSTSAYSIQKLPSHTKSSMFQEKSCSKILSANAILSWIISVKQKTERTSLWSWFKRLPCHTKKLKTKILMLLPLTSIWYPASMSHLLWMSFFSRKEKKEGNSLKFTFSEIHNFQVFLVEKMSLFC